MLPAYQCLYPAQTNITSALGLVIEDELATGHCLTQFSFQCRPIRGGRSHLRFKETHGVASRCLGLVHSEFCAFQWLFDAFTLRAAEEGDADAGGAVMPVTFNVIGLPQHCEDFCSHYLRLRGSLLGDAAQITEQYNEFVAAEPRHRVTLAHAGCQSLGDLFEKRIALVMAQGVVDGLEVIQVNEQQCVLAPMAGSGSQGLFEPVHQQPAVGQAGQWVGEGQSLYLTLGLLALGDVHRQTFDNEVAGLFSYTNRAVIQPVPIATGILDPILNLERDACLELFEGLGDEGAVFGVNGLSPQKWVLAKMLCGITKNHLDCWRVVDSALCHGKRIDNVWRVLHDAPIPALAFKKSTLRRVALGNVAQGNLNGSNAIINNRCALHFGINGGSVKLEETHLLHRQGAALLGLELHPRAHDLSKVGVDPIEDGLANQVLRGPCTK